MRYFVLLVCSLLLLTSVSAVDDAVPPVDAAQYPTYRLLQNTTLPIADRTDIARRFYGVHDIPAPPQAVPPRQIGERQIFTLTDGFDGGLLTIEAELRAVGESVYVWLEVGSGVADFDAQRFAERFDTEVYSQMHALWGEEDIPGIDGDPRLYAVFTHQLNAQIAGYFAGQNTYSRLVYPNSNEHEMIIFNLGAFLNNIEGNYALSIAAHEFQHVIRRNLDLNEQAWIDEGFSMLTEYLLRLSDTSWASIAVMESPATPLNQWGTTGNLEAEYGAPMLFLLYFYERFGEAGIRRLSEHPANGLIAVDAVLREIGAGTGDGFYADWVLANILRDDDFYGYRSLSSVVPAADAYRVTTFPYPQTHFLHQYAARYFEIDNPPATISIELDVPREVGLIPISAASGDYIWYSNRGDDSNSRLTRAFDLRGVTHAELRYRVWYALEEGWDYAYVSVSNDGGQTWDILPTYQTTDADPNGKAYGVGYTGESGGWRTDGLNLDAYLGQQILVRFEMITDDSLNEAGLALDDIALDAVNYASDFESDGGGWQADGWLRTDNRLPQRVWVQAVEHIGDDVSVTRWLAQGASTFTLNVAENVERVTLAISPFAPVTSVTMPYSLIIDDE